MSCSMSKFSLRQRAHDQVELSLSVAQRNGRVGSPEYLVGVSGRGGLALLSAISQRPVLLVKGCCAMKANSLSRPCLPVGKVVVLIEELFYTNKYDNNNAATKICKGSD